jgi:post-segregation antitoxin (ccd killing protein)
MARIQVYVPDEMHRRIKDAGISPSELLQRAVEDELRRRDLLVEVDKYIAELVDEVGEPSAAEREYARRFVDEMLRGRDRATA